MSKQLLTHVFATVAHLERSLDEIDSLLCDAVDATDPRVRSAQHRKVVGHMRRTANKLQMALAADNPIESHRCMNIFYALNQMVRPEIVRQLAKLLNPNLRVRDTAQRQAAH